ncbi:protocatechuate 3,4-dioxygenase beta subunit [Algoriphagus ornithinivorans]|uniref:Protocatechuate 3,4-dioxygenase beta subunit n=1 Tax=Algoriphagus ornithinivorans TaxID=226506 RepID=A0A1I5DSG0_9BACT|nr:intradiol ring-cleavage dioxygenase [Algoriphagus ornithinivorans]SFO01711.1 protocatechuate 3,4-dioxygenase beta subunit [Algoriphagus ornithinivorans]
MKTAIILPLLIFVVFSCNGQDSPKQVRKVGGPCEGCEALMEFGDQKLNSVDTLPGFLQNNPKLMLTGTVYQQDGKTPAKDVILYIYHTNREGIYEKKGDEKGWARRHGHIRGWVKTSSDGRYSFFTFRPAPYPGGEEVEHIHITVKEPSTIPYYIDDFIFLDDPLLTEEEKRKRPQRGGSGIFLPKLANGILTINRDIILGKNIPDY